MKMRQRGQQSNTPSLKEALERSGDEIARRWLAAVREDRATPSAEDSEGPLLQDAVPLLLDEILKAAGRDDGKVGRERIRSAARHGLERAQEHFDVGELVREYQLLRESIFLHLRGRAGRLARLDAGGIEAIYFRVGVALDEAMRETIHAFVEEHVRQLRRLSRTDSLTGLFNHRIFYECLTDELSRARRYDSPLSVVLIDLDNFKAINDTKGHQFGDRLLMTCAEQLRVSLRQTDILCRYGGDEFGLILTGTTGPEAQAMMCRLTEDFGRAARLEGVPDTFGMSFGVSSHPEDDGTVRRMVKVADERLSLNKHRHGAGLVLVE